MSSGRSDPVIIVFIREPFCRDPGHRVSFICRLRSWLANSADDLPYVGDRRDFRKAGKSALKGSVHSVARKDQDH